MIKTHKVYKYKGIALDILWGTIALSAGSAIVYFGDRLLNVSLEVYFGISTFSPIWVLDLIFVPLVAGFVVSLIYGLGGKILAHFAPLIVRVFAYYSIDTTLFPDGVSLLPIGYWVLIVIVSVEAAAAGGLIGEFVIKKTYGRRPKHLIHKRYQLKNAENTD